MYESPTLERYGSFRELTLGGGAEVHLDDASTFDHTDHCIQLPNGYQCVSV